MRNARTVLVLAWFFMQPSIRQGTLRDNRRQDETRRTFESLRYACSVRRLYIFAVET